MCGLAGFLAPRCDWTATVQRHYLEAMTDAIAHRGPDGEGFWQDSSCGLALGHRRLAIRDLSPAGRQPMVSRSGRWVVCFNGELYDHQAVRGDLESRGHAFRGRSDTETLVAACEEWGFAESLTRFAGMFAIAAWDVAERRIYLARDRMGEKPLYYGRVGGVFAFASEIKALRPLPGWTGRLDRQAVGAYLDRGYVPAPLSIYQGIRKLRPGTWIGLSTDQDAEDPIETPYWRLADVIREGRSNRIDDPLEAVERLDSLLKTVVREQMDSDVPLGAFLSGGVDSSCVTSLMQTQSSRRIRTFTIGFDSPRLDESAPARNVARHLGTDHTEMRVTSGDALAMLPTMGAIYDEPFADPSQLPTALLARLTRQHVTVSLSGDGGDELFGGYAHYPAVLNMARRLRPWPRVVAREASRATLTLSTALMRAALRLGRPAPLSSLRLRTLGLLLANPSPQNIADVLTNPNLRGLSGAAPPVPDADATEFEGDGLAQLTAHDQRLWLPDNILVKLDRATMAASLESRAPLLDHRVVELAWRLSSELKLREGVGKWTLRQVLERYVPRELFERPKQGFCVPLAEWLQGPLKSWANDLLSSSHIQDLGLGAETVGYAAEKIEGTTQIDRRRWAVLMFASWAEHQCSVAQGRRAA